MGGTEVADQSVKVDASSAEQATITLANLIPGEAEVKIEAKWSRQVKAMHWKEATRMTCELSLQKEPLKPVVLTLDCNFENNSSYCRYLEIG